MLNHFEPAFVAGSASDLDAMLLGELGVTAEESLRTKASRWRRIQQQHVEVWTQSILFLGRLQHEHFLPRIELPGSFDVVGVLECERVPIGEVLGWNSGHKKRRPLALLRYLLHQDIHGPGNQYSERVFFRFLRKLPGLAYGESGRIKGYTLLTERRQTQESQQETSENSAHALLLVVNSAPRLSSSESGYEGQHRVALCVSDRLPHGWETNDGNMALTAEVAVQEPPLILNAHAAVEAPRGSQRTFRRAPLSVILEPLKRPPEGNP